MSSASRSEAVVAVGRGRFTQLGPNEAVLQLRVPGGPREPEWHRSGLCLSALPANVLTGR